MLRNDAAADLAGVVSAAPDGEDCESQGNALALPGSRAIRHLPAMVRPVALPMLVDGFGHRVARKRGRLSCAARMKKERCRPD